MALRCTMCSGRLGASGAKERTSEMAYVSNDAGREERKVLYSSSGPTGTRGGRDVWTESPTESAMGGIISAWNIKTVGSSW